MATFITYSLICYFKDREENLAEVSLNLQNIFRVLKGCTIDPGIMAINTQQDDQRKQRATLFDYIDHQSVLDIQKQADDEIGDIEASVLSCEYIETTSDD